MSTAEVFLKDFLVRTPSGEYGRVVGVRERVRVRLESGVVRGFDPAVLEVLS